MALRGPYQAQQGAASLLSPVGLLPSPLDKFHFSVRSPAFAVKDGRLSFDDILVHGAGGSGESSHEDALECFKLEQGGEPLARARSGVQLDLFAAGGNKLEGLDQAGGPGSTELEGGHSAKLPHKAAPGSTQQPQQRIPALWNENELLARSSSADTKAPTQLSNEPSLDISFGMVAHAQTHPSATAAGEVAPSPPTATEAGGQQATSTLQAPQASALDTAEDVRPRLAGMKRSFEMARTTSFSFPILTQPPQAAPRAGGEKKGKIQYDRMRELETHVQQIRQVGDALRQAVRRADQQHAAAVNENQQLWALVAHLAACLRAGHEAQKLAHQASLATEGSPDHLLGPLFSPDDNDLAAACGMFISPAKPVQATTAGNKPRKLFEEALPANCAAAERCALGAMPAAEGAPLSQHIF